MKRMRRLFAILIILAFAAAGLHADDKTKKRFGTKRDKTATGTTTTGSETGDSSSVLDKIKARKDSGASREMHISPAQQQNIDRLQADLNAIKANSQVTPDQVKQLQKDLMAAVDGATKPSQQSVEKLAQDLANAWSDQKLTPKEQAQLMDDIYAILNSANISQQEAEALLDDVKGILKASGLSYNDVQTIVNDLEAIVNEVQKNAGNIKNNMPTLKKKLRR